jgi:tRNA pseudouridine65 synthase
MDTLMLHASSLSFVHPVNMEKIVIKADLQSEFKRMLEELKLGFRA